MKNLIIFLTMLVCLMNGQDKVSSQKMEEKKTKGNGMEYEVTTIGGGCFWCSEAIYQELNGVMKVESGYSGGDVKNPSYEQVCTGKTNHAEVIQVTFDPKIISYKEILYVFFRTHDPTTLNRQGNDVGTQYRSVIFYHSEEQKKIAEEVLKETNDAKVWDDPIVTEISPYEVFYKAESYHQNYFNEHSYQPYCMMVINPKLNKFRKQFSNKLKK